MTLLFIVIVSTRFSFVNVRIFNSIFCTEKIEFYFTLKNRNYFLANPKISLITYRFLIVIKSCETSIKVIDVGFISSIIATFNKIVRHRGDIYYPRFAVVSRSAINPRFPTEIPLFHLDCDRDNVKV